jgi:hypothetical protein
MRRTLPALAALLLAAPMAAAVDLDLAPQLLPRSSDSCTRFAPAQTSCSGSVVVESGDVRLEVSPGFGFHGTVDAWLTSDNGPFLHLFCTWLFASELDQGSCTRTGVGTFTLGETLTMTGATDPQDVGTWEVRAFA